MNTLEQLQEVCDAAEVPIYGEDFLCRALAVIHCYGGGPGGEFLRAGVGHHVAMKAGSMLEQAVLEKNWKIIKTFQAYVSDLQNDRAFWLEKTLERLTIPAGVIKFQECLQPKSPQGS